MFQGNWIKTEGGDWKKKHPKNGVLSKTNVKIRKLKFSIIFLFMLMSVLLQGSERVMLMHKGFARRLAEYPAGECNHS